MNKSKTEHILYGTLFVVEMYKWGGLEGHHYTAGVFDNEQDAKACGIAEFIYRGNKYEPKIYKHNINEWRNGNNSAMYKEIERQFPDKTLEELWEKFKS